MNLTPQNYIESDKKYRSAEHIVFSCQYHVIFCPKYRRRLLVEPYDVRLKEIFNAVADEYGFSILDMEIMPDHVHMVIDCNPRFGICKCVQMLKGRSSNIMRNEFPELKRKLPSLWTRSSFVSSVGAVTLDVVKQYIEDQKGK